MGQKVSVKTWYKGVPRIVGGERLGRWIPQVRRYGKNLASRKGFPE